MAWRRLILLSCSVIRLALPRCTMLHLPVLCIHTPVPQIHERRRWFCLAVPYQDGRLLQLIAQGVAIVRVAMEAQGTDHQVAPERAGNAHLHAELVGLLGLAL